MVSTAARQGAADALFRLGGSDPGALLYAPQGKQRFVCNAPDINHCAVELA